ncbi:MAG: reverse transcriptase/maturase family protein [Candidatus Paceibacterota bacterium]|jgi:retron-type reverse transcriptase
MNFPYTYDDIISLENLLAAWREFVKGKRKKLDVREFNLRLMDNIISLHEDLRTRTYRHGDYQSFRVYDPKPRNIHKASVRDRLLHRAIYRKLYPFFDQTFIADSFSCRNDKGTHKALNRFRRFVWKVSKNNTKTCWILKCDVRKFFASVDHHTLLKILTLQIQDENILWLLRQVVESFNATGFVGIGLPLGNLTSQLFANIYLNEFDQLVKHKIKAKFYIRYADDFVVFSENRDWLEKILLPIKDFFWNKLKLQIHPDKIFIKTIASGLDFLGWVHFPNHRVLRTSTRRRMFRNLREDFRPDVIASYLGMLKWGNAHILSEKIRVYAMGSVVSVT